MKKLVFITLLACSTWQVSAQQDPMFSQYLYNTLAINPAYAGSRGVFSSTLFYRNQWTGFEGAPVTANASAHAPLNGTSGSLGLNIYNDRIGVQSQSFINASYAYRMLTRKGNLSFGLSAGMYHFNYNWAALNLENSNDPVFDRNESLNQFNMGAGIYYQTSRLAIGLSAPHLLNHKLLETEGYEVTRPHNHFFLMGSYLIRLSDDYILKPSTMFKYVANAPIQADFNMTVIYKNRLYLGASYRTTNEFNVMAQFQISDRWWVGYAYDLAVGDLSYISNGSHELFVGFEFSLDKSKILSPRYF